MAKAKASKRASSSAKGQAAATGRQMGAFRLLQVGSHFCYMRAHEGEDERTMFLVNLPIDTTERHLKAIFAHFGAIESVRLWKGRSEVIEEEGEDAIGKSAKMDGERPAIIPLPSLDPRHPHHLLPTATSAHVTFLDESSLQRALLQSHIKSWPEPFLGISQARELLANQEENQQVKKKAIRTAEEAAALQNVSAPPVGLEYLLARHRSLRPALADVKAHVDSIISNYDYRRAHHTKKKSGIQAVSVGPNGEMLDEDGFVIVQSTGKYGRTADGEVGSSVKVARRRGDAAEAEDAALREKKRKRFELEDFYRFQRREEKREELAGLRAKFREDQEKVKKLKASRNFKPF